MLENELTIVISSKSPIGENRLLIDNIVATCEAKVAINYIVNDGSVSLSKVYSDALKEARTNIVIFMHDDIEFLRNKWGAQILRMFNEHQDYGIIGIAGSAEFDENAAWWNYEKIYGQVLHRNEGKSWLTTFSPLLKTDLEEVCVIDGLFMAVHKQRISKGFDESLDGFNMYDIDFCLNNFLDGKTKIGVTTHIRIAHNSIGEVTENWYLNKIKINDKYGKNYPIRINK